MLATLTRPPIHAENVHRRAYVTGICRQVCERSWMPGTTATIAGYASTNVSHLPVRQFSRIRRVLRGFTTGVCEGQGTKDAVDTMERICRDRRHVESLCRDSSCAVCVVCRKRDAARHTAQLRGDAMPFYKSYLKVKRRETRRQRPASTSSFVSRMDLWSLGGPSLADRFFFIGSFGELGSSFLIMQNTVYIINFNDDMCYEEFHWN